MNIGNINNYSTGAAGNIYQKSVTEPSFLQKAEEVKTAGEDVSEEKKVTDYQTLLEEKKKELFTKIKNGDTEPSFQIGADSFTLKGWNEFLSRFDSSQDTVEEMQKALKEQAERAYFLKRQI